MPCTGSGSTGSQTAQWYFTNWARTSVLGPLTRYRPADSEQLAAAIVATEGAGRSIKAMGSGWSYTGAAVDPSVTDVIDMTLLNADLTGSPEATDNVIPSALRDPLRPAPDSGATTRFIHVQAGITIYDLNNLLDSREPRLAMPTLGGANGQTLSGAISTGTHGADFNLPPIADCVRAIHLISNGGQEWWLERSGANAITEPARLAAARDAGNLCGDIRIQYDDELFRAALVSLGRMGVICSVVIEAVPAFRLEETRSRSTWSQEASWIRTAVVAAGAGDVQEPFRFKEIVVNPYPDGSGARPCLVTTRRETTSPANQGAPPFDGFRILCDVNEIDQVLNATLATLPALIAAASIAAVAGLSWMLAIPFVGALLYGLIAPTLIAAATSGIIALQTALIAVIGTGGANIADKLAGIINAASALRIRTLVPALVGAFVQLERPIPATPKVDDGFRLMTGQTGGLGQPRPDDPVCMRRIDGFEFAFSLDPGRPDLFQFMDDVFALTDEFAAKDMPMGFGMSVRITRGTSALIGMQQWTRTAHVEFFFLRGLRGQGDFYGRLHAAAARRRGTPHWGLIHSLDRARVEAIYGGNLTRWRQALARVVQGGGGRSSTFRTTFSMDRGLEPPTGCSIPAFLVERARRLGGARRRGRGLGSALAGPPR